MQVKQKNVGNLQFEQEQHITSTEFRVEAAPGHFSFLMPSQNRQQKIILCNQEYFIFHYERERVSIPHKKGKEDS